MAKKRSAREAARQVKDKWRSKQWYTIRAPQLFNETEIGETLAEDPEKVQGRVAEATLQDVTGDFSKQHVKCYFRIRGTRGTDAVTTFEGHDLTSDYVRRLVRRSHSKIDGVFDVTTADGFTIRLKPMIVSERRTQSEQASEIRRRAEEKVMERSDMTYDELVKEMLEGDIAREIYEQARLIVPVKRVEIRKSELLSEPSDAEETLDVFAPPAEEEEDEEADEAEDEGEEADEEPEADEEGEAEETAEEEPEEDLEEPPEAEEETEAAEEPEPEEADEEAPEDEEDLAEDVTEELQG